MAVAQGSCPNCGAPIEFSLGASLAKVCEYCRHTVVRTDRGLSNLGKAADLAHTPSLIAVGDEGKLAGRVFRVFGRAQLDHGAGPWDEYYVGFDYGQSWGFLAYAQGEWHVTAGAALAPGAVPQHGALEPEQDLALGSAGTFRVAEVKTARVTALEGEMPGGVREGMTRLYADLWGQGRAFATLDYGERDGAPALFVGYVFAESELSVTALGPRSSNKVQTATLKCPNCGGDVPKLSGERAERLGCPYCGAISDIALRTVVAQQEQALKAPDIPIGTRGTLAGQSYVCIAHLTRVTSFEGEPYRWDEYLLFAQGAGFRWLVKDPESGWSFVTPVNLAELDLRAAPSHVVYQHRPFQLRNQNTVRVSRVLGEVHWKCTAGETISATDYVSGRDVLSREAAGREVRWSLAQPVPWPAVARAFGLPLDSGGSKGITPPLASPKLASYAIIAALLLALVLLSCILEFGEGGGGNVVYGGGVVVGGK
jgi:DNA-directed RNA polymerase subunit RPC12/RpoP